LGMSGQMGLFGQQCNLRVVHVLKMVKMGEFHKTGK
jgi:hypothetical protein